MDTFIFGLRFKSDESLQPSADDLAVFLGSPRTPGAPGTREDDLEVFIGHQKRVEAYEQGLARGLGWLDFSERLLLGVLSHTRFFRPALRIAIEEYLYHHHEFLQLDFNKPESFIRSAEDEMGRLSAGKKDDQQKIARLQALIDQRKKDLAALTKRRRVMVGELCHIAAYVLENLEKVRQLSEDAIALLARLQAGGDKTVQLIEDLKAYFKDEVREYRQMRMVTPEYLESVKTEVAKLSQLLTGQVRGDIVAVTGIYENFRVHAVKNTVLLRDLISRAELARKNDGARDVQVFTEIESALIGLISEFRPGMKAPEQAGAGERHEDLLREKRREFLDHIFLLLRDEHKKNKRTS